MSDLPGHEFPPVREARPVYFTATEALDEFVIPRLGPHRGQVNLRGMLRDCFGPFASCETGRWHRMVNTDAQFREALRRNLRLKGH